jgi:hypothetical protein
MLRENYIISLASMVCNIHNKVPHVRFHMFCAFA